MSWSLGSITAGTHAVGAARRLLHSASQAVDFESFLSSSSEASPSDREPESEQTLLEKVTGAIREQLGKLGLGGQGDMLLSTQPDGTLRLESPHDLPAAVEAALASEPTIRQQVAQLHAASGPTQLQVGWHDSESSRGACQGL